MTNATYLLAIYRMYVHYFKSKKMRIVERIIMCFYRKKEPNKK